MVRPDSDFNDGDLAEKEGIDRTRMAKLLKLSRLAPDIYLAPPQFAHLSIRLAGALRRCKLLAW